MEKVKESKAWAVAFGLSLLAAIGVGWVLNLVAILNAAFNDVVMNTAELAIRLVGIFVIPLGSILGFF